MTSPREGEFTGWPRIGEPLTATRKDRYRILRYFSPLLGWRNLHFTAQITGFPEIFSNPQRGKSKDFSAGKCHLLYFVVVSESLTGTEPGPETGTVGTVFPATERGTGTAGTVFPP